MSAVKKLRILQQKGLFSKYYMAEKTVFIAFYQAFVLKFLYFVATYL